MSSASNQPPADGSDFAATGNTVLVTGGTRGIGLAIAKAFASDGASVAITYSRDEEAAEDALSRLRELIGDRALLIRADATSWEDGERTINEVEEHLGPLTTLVNNVGWGMLKPIHDIEPSFWHWMWKLNFESAVIHSMHAGRRMLERGAGSIVSVSSVSSMVAFERRAAHCAAKAALNMLTQSIALEWGARGVRANAVAPAVVATDYVKGMMDRGLVSEEIAVRNTPLARMAEEAEIASAVCFLASDAASYINGHVLVVDGGWTIHAGGF